MRHDRDERRKEILQHAHRLFLERGFHQTKLKDVMKGCGGSLALLYELFPDKIALLRAVVEAHYAEQQQVGLREESPGASLEARLLKATSHILDRMPDSVPILRLVAALSHELPELGPLLLDRGLRVVLQSLQRILVEIDTEGLLHIPDPELAATLLLRMTMANYEAQILCGVPMQMDSAKRRYHLDSVVGGFIRMFAPVTMATGEGAKSRRPASTRRRS